MVKNRFLFVKAFFCLIVMLCCCQPTFAYKWRTSHSGNWNSFAPNNSPTEQNGEFLISRPEQLAYISYISKEGTETERKKYLGMSAKYVLTNDLDMGKHYWTPIGQDKDDRRWEASFDGRGHTIRNLYVYKDDDCSGLIGVASAFRISNLVLRDCYAEGEKYTGLLLGWAVRVSAFGEINNVQVYNGHVYSNDYKSWGGLIGEMQKKSTVTILNSYVSCIMPHDEGEASGQFVGKVYGSSKLTIKNCIADVLETGFFAAGKTDKFRGGFVGIANDDSYVDLTNCGLLTAYGDADVVWNSSESKSQGLFVGALSCSCEGKASVNVTHCYLNSNAQYRVELHDKDSRNVCLFGKRDTKVVTASYDNLHYVLSHYYGAWRSRAMAYMNKYGARVGLASNGSYLPLPTDTGKVISMGVNENVVKVEGALPANMGIKSGEVFMPCYKESKFELKPDTAFWYLQVKPTKVKSSQRLGKYTFSCVPEAVTSGSIACQIGKRPVITLSKPKYNVIRQRVSIEWNVDCDEHELKTFWENTKNDSPTIEGQTAKPQWVIYRNGEKYDSVAIDKAHEWYDEKPLMNQSVVYKVALVNPQLFYDYQDNIIKGVEAITCTKSMVLQGEASRTATGISYKIQVPNSKAFDDCKVSLWKVVYDDDGQAQPAMQVEEPVVFHYSPSSKNDYLELTLSEKTNMSPCSRWGYYALFESFSEESLFYGETLKSAMSLITPTDAPVVVEELYASKGESVDKVVVQWKTKKMNEDTRYLVYRKEYDANDAGVESGSLEGWDRMTDMTNNRTTNSYTDNVLPGYVYKYRLLAYKPCDGSYKQNAPALDTLVIGYAASRGTVMGKISYSAGSAVVPGVDVRIASDASSLQSTGHAYAFHFLGAKDQMELAQGAGQKFWDGDWTLQFLFRPSKNNALGRLATVLGHCAVLAKNDTLYMNDVAMPLPYANNYNYVMLKHEKKAYSLGFAQTESPANWVVTVKEDDMAAWMQKNMDVDGTEGLFFGKVGDRLNSFKGFLDEVRVWKKALTATEIKNTYNRYLTGNEKNLAAYYTFDSGVAEFAFDNSHPGGIWNKRDSKLPNVGYPELINDLIPNDSILCYRGVTDDNGEYQIAGIPFVGEGTNYMVTPIYGTHQFQPASTRRYVSSQSLTHNDVDFADKSSFRVPVKATYIYGNIPAAGLTVMVDGVSLFDKDNNPIVTDENGEAVASVPIGKHRLKLVGANHQMMNNGYACSVTAYTSDGKAVYKSLPEPDGYYDFQSDLVAPMTFVDSTLVRVVGRVAGGYEEAGKPVGLHLGDANLGQMELTISPVGGKSASAFVYVKPEGMSGDLSQLEIPANAGDSIATKTIYPNTERYVKIRTDAVTGEYMAMLPPVTWRVDDVRAVGNPSAVPFQMSRINNVIDINLGRERMDTLYVDSIKDGVLKKIAVGTSLKYHARRDYIQYNEPDVTFTTPAEYLQADADSLMLGCSSLMRSYTKVVDGVNVTKTEEVPLWMKGNHDGTEKSYVLGYPVFETGCDYAIDIYLSEKYTNYTTGKVTRVPIKGALVTIDNKMACSYFKPIKTGDGGYEVVDTLGTKKDGVSSKAGYVNYTFTAGLPNLTEADHAWPMTLKYLMNDTEYTIEKPLKGIVLGAINRPGSNFVTAGPNIVDFVLRDPPGSNSTAYLERGSTMTSSYSITTTTETKQSIGRDKEFGTEVNKQIVSGVILSCLLGQKNSTGTGFLNVTSQKGAYSHGWNLSYTLTDRISTSSNPYYVGAMGDVYIGTSRNYIFATADALQLYPADDGAAVTDSGQHFKVMRKVVDSQRDSLATTFMYAQYDILNMVIPNLKDKRNALVTWVNSLDEVPQTNPGDDFLYYALKSSKDKNDWDENIDFVSLAPKETQKAVDDKVLAYTQWIKNWEEAIRAEEKRKYIASKDYEKKHFSGTNASQTAISFDYGYLDNVSFGSGASYSKSFKVSDASTGGTDFSFTEANNQSWTFHFKNGTEAKLNETKAKTDYGFSETLNRKATDSESASSTVGFNMSDSDVGDNFSVSLYLPGKVQERMTSTSNYHEFMPESYMFFTRGGQSRNPWEKTQMSLFYKLDGQSVPLDGGTESMNIPYVKFDNTNIFNVPTGTTASATVTLANNSKGNTAYKAFYYNLRCLNLNEMNGLEVLVNGQQITNGVTVQLPPNSQPKKYQIDFKQTNLNVSNYDKLVFELRMGETAATDTVNVHFEPRAPKPAFKLNGNSNVVNKKTPGKKILFNLSGYSKEYYHFGGIRLKYRKQGNVNWNTQITLVNDSALLADTHKLPESHWRKLVDKADTVSLDMSLLNDGRYDVVAEGFSVNGYNELMAVSDTVAVIKDTQAPDYFGKLLPAGGYYSGTQEIGATFTEPINEDYLLKDNIVVKAVLNDAEVTHRVGLHFDGNMPAHTKSKLKFLSQNSTIAFWYKPVMGKKSCLFSQTVKDGKDKDKLLALYYNEDASLTLQLGEKSFTNVDKKAVVNGKPFEDWMYAVVTVDKDQDKMLVYNLYGTVSGDEALFLEANQTNHLVENSKASLYVGGSATGEACYADMEGMVIYDKAQSLASAAANMGKTFSNTRGLLSYWPMNESFGNIAKDKIRRRDLTLSGTDNWYIPVVNYALKLNGENQYMNINTSACPISKDEDYVLEFWFRSKGEADRDMTLFSNGWGASESTETNKSNRLSISLLKNGHIGLSAAGRSCEMGTKRYDDNCWHYLSLNVQRDAYLTLAVDTVELSTNQVIAGNSLAGFENSKMTLGALRYVDAPTQKEVVTNYFNGELDEVRLWNAHRTNAVVNQTFNTRLDGNEPGLVAYYPFEFTEIIANQEKTSPSITDHVQTSSKSNVYRAQTPELVGFTATADTTMLAKEATDAFGPKLKSASIMSPIEMNYKLSSDKTKLLLEFPSTLAKSRIENCNVNISVRYLEDMYGNRMEQPLEWTIYVQQADLYGSLEDNVLTQQVGSSTSTSLLLYNAKSTAMDWEVVNCPSWLKLSRMMGKLKPMEAEMINVETVAGTPIGSYQENISVVDADGITQNYPVELTVTGVLPDWKVDVQDDGTWMGIVGRLMIENKYVSNENDLVAVFDDKGQCHGLGNPKYDDTMDTYFLQMNILGGGLKNGSKLYFRVWDAASGLVYTDVNYQCGTKSGNSIEFLDNSVLGNFKQLCILNAKQQVRQLASFEKGWTWMSTWIKPMDETKKNFTYQDVFGTISDKVAVVKAKEMPKDFRLLNIKPSESYRVYVNEPCKVELSGSLVDPDDVKLKFYKVSQGNTRWYWIGYPLHKTLPLDEAFSDLTPEKGDVVKGQKSFAMYNGKTWVGSLSYLVPGDGYMYGYTGQRDQEWYYPSSNVMEVPQLAKAMVNAEATEKHLFSSNPKLYGSNMTMVAKLEVDGTPAANYQVGAFVDGECRGWLKSNAEGLVYLTISGDTDQQQISYRAYNPANGRVLAVHESDSYVANGKVGTCDEPRLLTASETGHFNLDIEPDYYENYAYVLATVLDANSQVYAHDYELAAFDQTGKCCGISTANAKEKCYIPVYGNVDDTFTFKLWDKETCQEYVLDGKVEYDVMQPIIPVTLRLLPTGIQGVEADADGKAKLYDINGVRYNRQTKRAGTIYIENKKKIGVK